MLCPSSPCVEYAHATGPTYFHFFFRGIVTVSPGNDISKEGASSLSFMLRRNKSLRVLSLRDNRLGNEGVLVLCEGMRENSALLQLDLHNNGIGDAGIIPLVQAIIDNPHPTPLLVLGLGFNQIGSRGLAAVQKLPHSVRVDMEGW